MAAPPDRGSWPIRVYKLGSEPGDDLSASSTATERLEMVVALTREAWELTGRPWPSYSRSDAPVRRRRLAESAENP